MAYQQLHKPNKLLAQKRHDADEIPASQSNVISGLSGSSILQLQRTVGNQAVMRMLQHSSSNVLQRRPTPKPKDGEGKGDKEEAPLPPWVLRITGQRQGDLKGSSRMTGYYEGTIEIASLMPAIESNQEKYASLTFLKSPDASSEQFRRALAEGETLTEARFYRIKRDQKGNIFNPQNLFYKDGHVTEMVSANNEGNTYEQVTIQFRKPSPEKDGS